jgi:hypothetical protein
VSTDLKSWDYALQVAYSHFCTKLTAKGSYVRAKLGAGADLYFFGLCTKVPYFFTHNTPIYHRSTTETMSDGLQIIGRWPQKPSNTIADAFPRLRNSRGRQFRLGAKEIAPAEAQRWGDFMVELLFGTRCARERGPLKRLAPDPFESIK